MTLAEKWKKEGFEQGIRQGVRIAKAFEVIVDYLIREEENVAINKIKNLELLHKIVEIKGLPEEDQYTIISFLDAFIKRRK